MPRGGYRINSGGPRVGSGPKKKALVLKDLPADIRRAARKSGVSPLDYMLFVMRDETADPGRRDRMAVAAAVYVHAKPAALPAPGKKEEANIVAQTAHEDSAWGDLVH